MPRIPSFLICTVLLIGSRVCAAGESAATPVSVSERTPANFVDLYGMSTSAQNVSEHSFHEPGRVTVAIKGPFSVRSFRSGDLRVQAVFHLPSLKLAGVRLTLPRSWTREQVDAALMAYGSQWKLTGGNVAGLVRTSPAGDRAISTLNSLEIQSPEVVKAIEQVLQERDAQRKAVPKF